jgi:hypothetical protein
LGSQVRILPGTPFTQLSNNMKYGDYSDRGLDRQNINKYPWNDHKLNSHGYRCPEWDPMPAGKKNVVVLGCSHTFGQGLDDNQHWVHFLSKHNSDRLRYWNLGQPGASGDACVRRLWGTQKLLDPKIIIICWPDETRRQYTDPIHNSPEDDMRDFLHNIFWVEKFSEMVGAKTFYCFAHTPIQNSQIKNLNVLQDYSISNCWPYWDKFTQRKIISEPSLAKDGKHHGVEHHERFASLFLEKFGSKLK